jgi:hypothetical protein
MNLQRPFVLVTLFAALGLVACGSDDSPTLPNVVRSNIVVTVIPTPVEGVQNASTGAVSASYRISIQETAGLGCEVVFVSSLVFDPETGLEVARPIYYDSSDLVVFVGDKRVEPLQALVVPQTVGYSLPDRRKQANIAVLVQVKDDRGNTLNQSVMVTIE